MWAPVHTIGSTFNMTRDRFNFIWRHFHVCLENEDEEDTADDSEEQVAEICVDRISREKELEEENEEDQNEETENSDKRIFGITNLCL